MSLALAITTGSLSPLPVGSAAQVLGSNSYKMEQTTYTRIPDGQKPQSGDLGFAKPGTADGGGDHALIVKEVQGNVKFIAEEGNYHSCTATDDIPHITEQYAYYRKQ
jgi:hypothetical protein